MPDAVMTQAMRRVLGSAATPSRLHDERIAAILGIALGVAFTTCFVTGVLSHLIQEPPGWFLWTSRPAGLYRVTQSVHVATGLASIPLLFAKLWVVYPKLFEWPPFANIAHFLERVSLVPLIGGGLFELFTGLANINQWYPWPFNFRTAHFAVAWITIGALIVHIGAKWTVTRRALARPERQTPTVEPRHDALDRRRFLLGVFGTSGLVTLVTVGQTVRPLERLVLLAPRRPSVGPQGFPVNRSAVEAGVVDSARDPEFRLTIEGNVARPLQLSLHDMKALPQHEATLPIQCVEGWSTSQRWRGVPVRDLLEMTGADDGAEVRVESLQQRGAFGASDLNRWHAHDRDTLLALAVDGEPLHIDHGYPLRLIGPNPPGVMQTKWVTRLVVV
jgi:DMSO/TMAO reductase YedYZ molybdopterin-dependent catalytic subunit